MDPSPRGSQRVRKQENFKSVISIASIVAEMYSGINNDEMYHLNMMRPDKVILNRRDDRHFGKASCDEDSSQAQHIDTRGSIKSDESDEGAMGDELNSTEERLHQKVFRLFNISDFLYSFFFGLLPSLMDITTDFSFADRFRYNTGY